MCLSSAGKRAKGNPEMAYCSKSLPVTSPYTSTLIAMLFFHVCGVNRTNLASTGFEILFMTTELLFLFPLKTWDEIDLIYFLYQENMTASTNYKV